MYKRSTPAYPQIHSLVVVEHKGGKVAPPTLNTLTAAAELGGPVTALLAGSGESVSQAADEIAQVDGVKKVGTSLGVSIHWAWQCYCSVSAT